MPLQRASGGPAATGWRRYVTARTAVWLLIGFIVLLQLVLIFVAGRVRIVSSLFSDFSDLSHTVHTVAQPAADDGHHHLFKLRDESRNPFVTSQLCHVLADETEICTYEGPLCLAKDQVFVAVDPVTTPREAWHDDGRHRCLDFRHYERRASCEYSGPFTRPNLPREAYADAKRYSHRTKPASMPFRGRRWGPDDHGIRIDGIPWQLLVARTGSGGTRNLPLKWRKAANGLTPKQLDEAVEKWGHLARRMPKSVKWYDASGYIVPFDSGWVDHPWHYATAAFALWDAKQHNFTVANVPLHDGTTPGPLNYTIGGFRFPPMDYVVAAGLYEPLRYQLRELTPWMLATMPLLTQEHTKILLNGNLARDYSVSNDDWMCFTKGVITAVKPRVFTSVGDAHAFKLLAYAASNVTTLAHDNRPPPKITLLSRFDRGLYNMSMIMSVLNSTGLEVEVVEDMRFFSWEKQVALMAGTGILIAAHGGALANVMYLPAHAVVIEAFAYGIHFSMYRKLAEQANLIYYRIRGKRPYIPPGQHDPWAIMDEPDWVFDCEYPHHPGALDASLQRTCNGKSKISPVYIPEHIFREVIDSAIDDIGCRDGICRQDTYAGALYTDSYTGEQWIPVNAPWNPQIMPESKTVGNMIVSRTFDQRVDGPRWPPEALSGSPRPSPPPGSAPKRGGRHKAQVEEAPKLAPEPPKAAPAPPPPAPPAEKKQPAVPKPAAVQPGKSAAEEKKAAPPAPPAAAPAPQKPPQRPAPAPPAPPSPPAPRAPAPPAPAPPAPPAAAPKQDSPKAAAKDGDAPADLMQLTDGMFFNG